MTNPTERQPFSHIDSHGDARMVDVSDKEATVREAMASAWVTMKSDALDALFDNSLSKGDALATARIAGIQAAKKTADWIPLCHPLSLDWVRVHFTRDGSDRVHIECTAKCVGRTGVEMEAMAGVSAAALTLYDMVKAVDKSIVIGPIQLEKKTGGKSGTFVRS